ncbi:hypothetical protein BB561_005520 [Smittium simulii]|uniref:C3H1-type domain-containing protein n=1 Tax=Smittium simulii TaxID=133385 RepID=A0A2T9Y9Z9_9FUNG|nr:hypothetical protein BB561_005520 [Smittium simulii]
MSRLDNLDYQLLPQNKYTRSFKNCNSENSENTNQNSLPTFLTSKVDNKQKSVLKKKIKAPAFSRVDSELPVLSANTRFSDSEDSVKTLESNLNITSKIPNNIKMNSKKEKQTKAAEKSSFLVNDKCSKEIVDKNEEILSEEDTFKTELCNKWMTTGRCIYGDLCRFAHGKDELRNRIRHPKFRTKICKTFSKTGYCPYENRCDFVHVTSKNGKLYSGYTEVNENNDGQNNCNHNKSINSPKISNKQNSFVKDFAEISVSDLKENRNHIIQESENCINDIFLPAKTNKNNAEYTMSSLGEKNNRNSDPIFKTNTAYLKNLPISVENLSNKTSSQILQLSSDIKQRNRAIHFDNFCNSYNYEDHILGHDILYNGENRASAYSPSYYHAQYLKNNVSATYQRDYINNSNNLKYNRLLERGLYTPFNLDKKMDILSKENYDYNGMKYIANPCLDHHYATAEFECFKNNNISKLGNKVGSVDNNRVDSNLYKDKIKHSSLLNYNLLCENYSDQLMWNKFN